MNISNSIHPSGVITGPYSEGYYDGLPFARTGQYRAVFLPSGLITWQVLQDSGRWWNVGKEEIPVPTQRVLFAHRPKVSR